MEKDKISEFSKHSFLKKLNLAEKNHGNFTGREWSGSEEGCYSINPSTGENIAYSSFTTEKEYEETINYMTTIKDKWMNYPMPKRGEIIKEIGDIIYQRRIELGKLISLECGKVEREGVGEVIEIVDICNYACGLSRMLNGRIFQSERSDHVLYENWNPLGIIGVITAFNFPMAVLGWNLALGLVCGDLIVWKGHEYTTLCSIALTKIINEVLEKHQFLGVLTLVSGTGVKMGEKMINDKRIQLISFTGSTNVGRHVSKVVHGRFGKTILELGGNNACLVMDDANLDNVLPNIFFGAVGTCGQRCTSIRRVMVHEKIYDEFVKRLLTIYKSVVIGDALDEKTFCGPLFNSNSVKQFLEGVETAKKQGGKLIFGGTKYTEIKSNGFYVVPAIVEIDLNSEICQHEIFAPILYIGKIKSFEEGVKLNNSVPQGLSSSLFTERMDLVQKWMSPLGSDCGLVNVNVGTSGAEIGGAFGGEKETGGGRESGGDAWKQYMKQQTSCISYSKKLQLAQGIVLPKF